MQQVNVNRTLSEIRTVWYHYMVWKSNSSAKKSKLANMYKTVKKITERREYESTQSLEEHADIKLTSKIIVDS